MSPTSEKRPAVFVDKDDTVIRDVPYTACPALVDWMPGAIATLKRLIGAGFEVVMVTNQSGVAHGLFSEAHLTRYLEALRGALHAEGVEVAGIEYCPHHPAAALKEYRRFCACRKPNPGMMVRAAVGHGLDLSRSWMIGDLLDDVGAGKRAGCRSALLAVHADQVPPSSGVRCPDVTSTSLASIADHIIAGSRAVA